MVRLEYEINTRQNTNSKEHQPDMNKGREENSITIQEMLDVQTTSVTSSQGILNVLKHLMGVAHKTSLFYSGASVEQAAGNDNRYPR